MDTSLFFDYDISIYKEDKFYIDKITFSNNAKKALIKTDTEKIWRHSTKELIIYLDLEIKKNRTFNKKKY